MPPYCKILFSSVHFFSSSTREEEQLGDHKVFFSPHKGADRTEIIIAASMHSTVITSADCRAGWGHILYLQRLYQNFGTVKTKFCIAKKVLWWTSLVRTGTNYYNLKVPLNKLLVEKLLLVKSAFLLARDAACRFSLIKKNKNKNHNIYGSNHCDNLLVISILATH